MQSYHKDSDKIIYKINAAYDKAIQDINQDINSIFYQFAKSGDLTLEQTKRLLNQKIPNPLLKIYKRILPYIDNEDIKQWFINKINSQAYKARITRLEALKESIYANIKKVADVEVEQSGKLYLNNLNKSYYRNTYDIQKGIGQVYDFSPLPGSFIEEVLKNRWSGKNYSKRIWDNSEVLASKLEEVVTSGLMSGKSSQRMAKELEDLTMYGKFASERLIRTETTYITNQGEIESYKAAGIEEYIFLATLDLRTSEQCRAHDNKIYKVSEAVPGENLPPLHPYCRSTTGAYFGDKKYVLGQRIARDPLTGKTYLIDNMSYDEWYKQFVVDKYGEQDAAKFEKMIKNKSSDRKQYENYKAVLGKDAPKTFDNFRDLKYNDSEVWEELKLDYKKQNIRNYIKSDKQPKNIHEGRQNKHIIGTNEYEQYSNNLNKKGEYGPSYLTIDNIKIQELINEYSGSGEIGFNKNGVWDKKELILNNDELIGMVIDNRNGNSAGTTVFKIYYNEKGVHIVPDYPSKKKER